MDALRASYKQVYTLDTKEIRKKKRTKTFTLKEYSLGLKLSEFKQVKLPPPDKISYTSVLQRLETTFARTKLSEKNLKKIFITRKDTDRQTHQAFWDVYLMGHGMKAPSKKEAEKLSKQELTQEEYEAPLSQGVRIAGLSTRTMHKVVSFFNNDLDTHHFHYNTCFGPLYELKDVTDPTQPLRLSMILSAGAVSDAPVAVNASPYNIFFDDKTKKILIRSFIQFSRFFEENNKGKLPLEKILAFISDIVPNPLDPSGNSVVPSGLIPGLRWAQAFKVSKKIDIIHHAQVKALEAEEEKIVISDDLTGLKAGAS